MIRAVIDTNVLVSAILNPMGTPAQVINALYAGAFVPVVSEDILREYERVLTCKDLLLEKETVHIMLHYFRQYCLPLPPMPVQYSSPDPDDIKFVAAALSGNAAYVITCNKRHFPTRIQKLSLVSPREFMEHIRQNPDISG